MEYKDHQSYRPPYMMGKEELAMYILTGERTVLRILGALYDGRHLLVERNDFILQQLILQLERRQLLLLHGCTTVLLVTMVTTRRIVVNCHVHGLVWVDLFKTYIMVQIQSSSESSSIALELIYLLKLMFCI